MIQRWLTGFAKKACAIWVALGAWLWKRLARTVLFILIHAVASLHLRAGFLLISDLILLEHRLLFRLFPLPFLFRAILCQDVDHHLQPLCLIVWRIVKQTGVGHVGSLCGESGHWNCGLSHTYFQQGKTSIISSSNSWNELASISAECKSHCSNREIMGNYVDMHVCCLISMVEVLLNEMGGFCLATYKMEHYILLTNQRALRMCFSWVLTLCVNRIL